MPISVILHETVGTLLLEIRQKMTLASRLSRSLRVIGTDMDRSATYDFLLYIATTGLSRTVCKVNSDFNRKSQILPIPVYLTSPLTQFPLEIL